MLLQAGDGIAQRPLRGFVGGAVAGGIVTGGMAGGAIGEKLDQGGAQIGAGALGGPFRRRPHRQEIVAVHAQARQAIAGGLGGEGGFFRPRNAGIGRDRPLIVGDAENDRRVIDGGEGQRFVEIAFRGGAFADIGQRQAVVVFVGAGHRPAHGMAEAAAKIAGQRIESVFARRIENGKLAALQGISLIGKNLVDQINQRVPPRHQPGQHAIGGKAHVARTEHHGLGGADCFLAGGFHEEARLALTVRAEHPLFEQPGEQHGAQALAQPVRRDLRRPGADGMACIVQNTDQSIRHLMSVLDGAVLSGRSTLPAAGMTRWLKSGVSPGRAGGAGIWRIEGTHDGSTRSLPD